jgi:TM2 domain-containing membrane protein YozV
MKCFEQKWSCLVIVKNIAVLNYRGKVCIIAANVYKVIGSDGKVYGPADLDTVKQWCAQGLVSADTQVVDPISNALVRADQVPELAAHLQAPPPAAAPPPASPGPVAQPTVTVNNYVGVHPGMQPALGAKSKTTAALLCFFLGGLGIHRFYLGYNGLGIAMILIGVTLGIVTCGVAWPLMGIWALIDLILILTDKVPDVHGNRLV